MHEPQITPPEADDGPSVLDFTPVPVVRVHHNGWTERRQRDFIQALLAMGSVRHACRAVGKTRQSAYKLRERPGAESFAIAWDAALSAGYAEAFDRALERATRGIEIPLFYKGKRVGTKHRIDWRLAMAALNGSPPVPPQLRKNVAR